MRYSIIGATTQQVKESSGQNILETRTGIIFADLDEAGVARLVAAGAHLKGISEVKPDIFAPTEPLPDTGIEGYTPGEMMTSLGFTDQWRHIIDPPLYGEGFGIAVLDSGIRATHELIGGRIVYSRNFTSSPPGDSFGHGTGVASIALALAPRCDILDIKVIGDDGIGTDEAVVLGIDEVIRLREERHDLFPYVINLSLGGPDSGDPFDPMRVACRAALEKGIFVMAAAGNGGPEAGTVMSPASERYVVALGSVSYSPDEPETSFRVSSFSGRGQTREGHIKPDAVLPGENMKMADHRSDSGVITKSGTSFATPLASGIAVIHGEGVLKQAQRQAAFRQPDTPVTWIPITPAELVDYWSPRITVKPPGAPRGKDNAYGWGIPFGELVAMLLTGPSPATLTADLTGMVVPFMWLGMMNMMMRGMWPGRR